MLLNYKVYTFSTEEVLNCQSEGSLKFDFERMGFIDENGEFHSHVRIYQSDLIGDEENSKWWQDRYQIDLNEWDKGFYFYGYFRKSLLISEKTCLLDYEKCSSQEISFIYSRIKDEADSSSWRNIHYFPAKACVNNEILEISVSLLKVEQTCYLVVDKFKSHYESCQRLQCLKKGE